MSQWLTDFKLNSPQLLLLLSVNRTISMSTDETVTFEDQGSLAGQMPNEFLFVSKRQCVGLGVVVHTCNLSYTGVIGRRILVLG
jgi:hypothetical protein